MLIMKLTSFKLFYLLASVTQRFAIASISSSWIKDLQTSRDITLSFGELHAQSHFPSVTLLSDALHHQMNILISRLRESSLLEGKSDLPSSSNVRHPFMSCTKYSDYDLVVSQFIGSLGDSFAPLITRASAADDMICFTSFVHDTKELEFYSDNLSEGMLSLFIPVPDILKLDYSVLHTIDWAVDRLSESAKNLRTERNQGLNDHPIISDLRNGLHVELSVIFRPQWSPHSQDRSAANWLEELSRPANSHGRAASERIEHWDDFVWAKGNLRRLDNFNESSVEYSGSVGSIGARNVEMRRHLSESTEYAAVLERIGTLPPFDTTDRTSMRQESVITEQRVDRSSVHHKWSALENTYRQHLTGSAAGDEKRESCNYHNVQVEHRKNNVILKLGDSFFDNIELSAACFANVVVLLSSDPGVSRVALSRPMRTLNSNARPIMQSGGANDETYSDAGLDGTGVVVGISDTGIDEFSCYFKDPKGRVPRSSPLHPITDHSFRKVIQYVNFSGSSGDFRSGHGSHVAGTVAGDSLGDNNIYRGMAPAAKLAFFDIGAKSGDLTVPNDLAFNIFASAHSAGAKLHSNSWGGGYWYDSFCLEVDEYLYDNEDFLILFAAGNNGGEGYGSLLSPGLSKNALSVAASYSTRTINDLPSFSSIGPAPDGRTKPDVTAPGFSITSANANLEGNSAETCSTTSKAGTSMATPVTAGTAALILQYFQDPTFWKAKCDPSYALCASGPFTPKGTLTKALLIHSGVPMDHYQGYYPVGTVTLKHTPDIFQGYGRVNLANILTLKEYKDTPYTLFVEQAHLVPFTELVYKVNVKTLTKDLRVTLAWFDPPNPEFAARVLVHDIDIVIVSPTMTQYYGNSFEANKGVRDELNTNEQVTIGAENGLVTGLWTVKIQAKALPYVPRQNFSLVITVDGTVVPPSVTAVPTPISQLLFEKCPGNASSKVKMPPRLFVELAMFSLSTSKGWSSEDKAVISAAAVYQDKAGTVSSRNVAALADFKFDKSGLISRGDTCLPRGCYESSLSLGEKTKQSTSLSIPACGVFLAPLRSSQLFCIEDAVSSREVVSHQNVSSFKEQACRPMCEIAPHVSFDVVLFEEQGGGWMGGYYAITPLVSVEEAQVGTVNAVAAGTLEWIFSKNETVCIPVGRYRHNPLKALSSTDTSDAKTHVVTPQCFSMQLSIPNMKLPVFPMIDVKKAMFIHDGILRDGLNDSSKSYPCPFIFNLNVTYGILCIDPLAGMGNITYYGRKEALVGQTPVKSKPDIFAAYSIDPKLRVGSCSFPLKYSVGAVEKYLAAEPAPTKYPIQLHPSAAPSVLVPEFVGNFSCLRSCKNYPNVADFHPVTPTACNFFIMDIFYLCSSFAIAHSLCEMPACAASCKPKDYCYFGANVANNCPNGKWSSTTGSIKSMMSACEAALADGTEIDRAPNDFIKRAPLNIFAIGIGIAVGAILFCLCLFLKVIPGFTANNNEGRYSTLMAQVRRTELPTLDDQSTHSPDTAHRESDLQEISLNTIASQPAPVAAEGAPRP